MTLLLALTAAAGNPPPKPAEPKPAGVRVSSIEPADLAHVEFYPPQIKQLVRSAMPKPSSKAGIYGYGLIPGAGRVVETPPAK